jgi:hypothetical protein
MWHKASGDTLSWRAAPQLAPSACPPPAGPVQQQHNKVNVTVLYFETRQQLAAQEQKPRDKNITSETQLSCQVHQPSLPAD